LVIDEKSPFCQNLVRRLRQEDCEILLAERQTDIQRIFGESDIDVVLLNLDNTGRDGMLLLKWIRESWPETGVILINNAVQIALSIEGMKLGAFDDFLVPVDLDALIQRIRDAFHQRQNKSGDMSEKRY